MSNPDPIPVECAKCRESIQHEEPWLTNEHTALVIGQNAESIIVEARTHNGHWQYTTLYTLMDGPTWTREDSPVVAARATLQIAHWLRTHPIEQLRDQYRWCWPCAMAGRASCSSCPHCDDIDHACDGESCNEARRAAEGDRIDALYDAYHDEVNG